MTISIVSVDGTSTSSSVSVGTSTSANSGQMELAVARARGVTLEQVQNALYRYLQGMRAMGRTHIDIVEAAHTLNVSTTTVLAAARALKDKGVGIE
jgi:hypothetical protein